MIFDTVDEPTSCKFGPCNNIAWHGRSGWNFHGYITSDSNNVYNWIIVETYEPIPNFRIDKILETYGSPQRIFISTASQSLDASYPFDIVLAYTKENFILQYRWNASKPEDNFIACIQNGTFLLSISSRINDEWTNDEIKQEMYSGGDIDSVVLKPLDDVTGMTIDRFYEEFTHINGDVCLTTSSQYWP